MLSLLFFNFLLSNNGYCQTTVKSSHPKLDSFYYANQNSHQNAPPQNSIFANNKTKKIVSDTFFKQDKVYNNPVQHHPMYRDTRLGSSSPLYNTYKKNDYGAGAITTNPNK